MDLRLRNFVHVSKKASIQRKAYPSRPFFFFFYLRYDPAGAHIKKDLLKQHIPYKITVFIGQTALAAC